MEDNSSKLFLKEEHNDKSCPLCSHSLKMVMDDVVVKTRIPGKEKITIKDVRHYQCTICHHKEIEDNYKAIIAKTKKHIVTRAFNENNTHDEKRTKKGIISKLFLKK